MNKYRKLKPLLAKIFTSAIVLSCTVLPTALKPQPALSAERIRFNFSAFNFSVSLDTLELYAQEGEINAELGFYANFLDQQTLTHLRQVLQKRIDVEPILLYRFTRSPMVQDFLRGLGEVVSTHLGYNGFYPIRGAILSAAFANQGKGVSLVDVMRHFPTEDIWIDTERLFDLQDELTTFLEYRQAATAAIVKAAEREASTQLKANPEELADLRQPGSFSVNKQVLRLAGRRRNSPLGLGGAEDFEVNLYLPQETTEPAPVVILSHGFASNPRSFNYLGEHLASHGIVVAAPVHIGSDVDYELAWLEGRRTRALNPVEFIERPLDIKYVLDKLEQLADSDSNFQNKLNLEQVGVIGHSFGGYTALALAGAPINTSRIRKVCTDITITLNISLLLQCRAKTLPPFQYGLQDPRIKAVIAVNPVTSTIFGPESLSKIQIPTMLVASDEDLVAPAVPEQIHPFIWLTTPNKYLLLMFPSDHFANTESSSEDASQPTILEEITGVKPPLGKPYLKALSLAFVQAHIQGRTQYLPYLSAAYAQSIADESLNLSAIQSLTPEELEEAFGRTPPLPIIPD